MKNKLKLLLAFVIVTFICTGCVDITPHNDYILNTIDERDTCLSTGKYDVVVGKDIPVDIKINSSNYDVSKIYYTYGIEGETPKATCKELDFNKTPDGFKTTVYAKAVKKGGKRVVYAYAYKSLDSCKKGKSYRISNYNKSDIVTLTGADARETLTKRVNDVLEAHGYETKDSSFTCHDSVSKKLDEKNFDDYDVIACAAYTRIDKSASDCCKFVQDMYKLVGKNAKCYTSSTTKNPKPGSVMQWGEDKDGQRVHVAIYIDSNTTINGGWKGKVVKKTEKEILDHYKNKHSSDLKNNYRR